MEELLDLEEGSKPKPKGKVGHEYLNKTLPCGGIGQGDSPDIPWSGSSDTSVMMCYFGFGTDLVQVERRL